MKSKVIMGIMLTLLFIGMLTLAFNIQQAEALEPPATEWTRTYGGADFDGAWSVVQTSDGGYALAGYTASFGAGPTDAWLVKVDSSGNVEWSKTYGGADPDWAYSIVETSDEGYALAGETCSFGAGLADFWLVKVAGPPPPPTPPPVGGKAIPIDKPINKPELQTPWIWLSTIILSLVLALVYVKKRKRNREIIS